MGAMPVAARFIEAGSADGVLVARPSKRQLDEGGD